MDDVLFREEQRFRQKWLWALISIAPAVMIGVMGYAMFSQLVLHQPFGNKPMPDSMLVWFGPLMILVAVGIVLLFALTCLITEVRGDGVYIRYIPFHRRFHWFHFRDIVEAEAITYSALRDYGGWGIRYGRLGKAYNVSGNRGVMLTFGSGAHLMIGSQRADELAAEIQKHIRGPVAP